MADSRNKATVFGVCNIDTARAEAYNWRGQRDDFGQTTLYHIIFFSVSEILYKTVQHEILLTTQ